MRLWIFLAVLVLVGCDNNTLSVSANFSLFETSSGVVYLVNHASGELKVISSKQTVIVNAGEVFMDGEGQFFKYMGAGQIEQVDEIDSSVQQHGD